MGANAAASRPGCDEDEHDDKPRVRVKLVRYDEREVEGAKDELRAAQEEEDNARKVLQKLRAKLARKLEATEDKETEQVEDEITRIRRASRKAMDRVVDEIEESLRKALDKKIRNARDDFSERLEAEKRRAAEDGMRMVDEEAQDLNAHHKKRMQKIRDVAEQDIERLRDRLAAAKKD